RDEPRTAKGHEGPSGSRVLVVDERVSPGRPRRLVRPVVAWRRRSESCTSANGSRGSQSASVWLLELPGGAVVLLRSPSVPCLSLSPGGPMAFCLAELHLWSCRSSLKVADTDIGTYQFYDKGEPGGPEEHHFYREKQQFAEARGYTWTPGNQRPEKLRDSLKELENQVCLVHLSRHVQGSPELGPRFEKLSPSELKVRQPIPSTRCSADRGCVSVTLVGTTTTDCSAGPSGPLFARGARNNLEGFLRSLTCPHLAQVCCVDLPGLPGRRLDRRVHLNSVQDMALCWWAAVDNEAWPWSPVSSQEDRTNLVLLACGVGAGGGLKVREILRVLRSPRGHLAVIACGPRSGRRPTRPEETGTVGLRSETPTLYLHRERSVLSARVSFDRTFQMLRPLFPSAVAVRVRPS
ncbi:hypothetical protein Z043_113946, partial [Scleropages formosus]